MDAAADGAVTGIMARAGMPEDMVTGITVDAGVAAQDGAVTGITVDAGVAAQDGPVTGITVDVGVAA
jgi:hypothetical protein